MNDIRDSLIIGGGLYGLAIALQEARRGVAHVVLVEREPSLLAVASAVNQGRVHHGYHYPRSFLTGARSRQRYPQFVREYADCIDHGIEAYYAIARSFSKVTATQFVRFCERIGAPVDAAPQDIAGLFDSNLVEGVFRVEEAAFNARKLAQRLEQEARASGVDIRLGTEAIGLARGEGGWVATLREGSGPEYTLRTQTAYNCTYASLNTVLGFAGLAPIPLKHELAELALVDPPAQLLGRSVTVMCGPFFSVTPLPSQGTHVLSHVRYTPHVAWTTGEQAPLGWTGRSDQRGLSPVSRAGQMLADARRFLPCMADARYLTSLWAVKTILPQNEVDDGRPILMHRSEAAPGLVSIMGSKIDNLYDVLELLETSHVESPA